MAGLRDRIQGSAACALGISAVAFGAMVAMLVVGR